MKERYIRFPYLFMMVVMALLLYFLKANSARASEFHNEILLAQRLTSDYQNTIMHFSHERIERFKDEPSFIAMTADFFLVRPIGLVATVAGSALYIASTPFSLLGRNNIEARRVLFDAPFLFTFFRCLGCPST